MKKKLILIVSIIICLALGLTLFFTRGALFEAFNQSPSTVIVTELNKQEDSPQETTAENNALAASDTPYFSVPSAHSRHTIYKALTTGRAESSPADAPYFFDVRLTMKDGTTSFCRVWLDPDTRRAWVSDTQEQDSTGQTASPPSSPCQLTEAAATTLLKENAFQSVYLNQVWPQAAQLSQAASEDTLSVSLNAHSIDIQRTLPTQKKPITFTRTYTAQPPDIVTVTDFNSLSVLPTEPADSVTVTYYALAVSDLESAAAGTLDLNGRPSVQPQQSGHYAAAYTLTYGTKDPSYRGSVSGTFLMTLTSGVQPFLSHSSYKQGTIGCVALSSAGPSETHTYKLRLPFHDQDLFFAAVDGTTAAYFPIANNVQPGQYTAKVWVQTSVPSPDGPRTSAWHEAASLPFTVEKKNFTRQDLPATTEMVSLAIPENYAFDNEKVTAAKAQSNPAPYWQGSFILPASGRYSTYYGEERYVKGTFTNYHSGLDIACDADVPIAATADGKVVLAFPLRIAGNTVIIDHGAGIFSSYSHLNAFSVKEGDRVKAGDIIGACGSTGYSTGPHLHFSVSCGSVTFDPLWLMDQDLWEKAAAQTRQ